MKRKEKKRKKTHNILKLIEYKVKHYEWNNFILLLDINGLLKYFFGGLSLSFMSCLVLTIIIYK